VDVERVDDDEDDSDERREHDVHERGDKPLRIRARLLELAERLSAPLILEHLVRESERVADAIGVQLGAEPLGYDVDEVVLEVLRHARDERHTDRCREPLDHPADEVGGRISRVLGSVLVNDDPEDQRIEQREDLVDRRQAKGHGDEHPVLLQVLE
jgi:hypothetical protein